jgi:hypothetical protein
MQYKVKNIKVCTEKSLGKQNKAKWSLGHWGKGELVFLTVFFCLLSE